MPSISRKRLHITLQLILVASLVFCSLPALDIWLSELLYDRERGRFVGVGNDAFDILRDLLSAMLVLTLILALLGLVSGRWLRPYAPWPNAKACLFVLLVALIGPYFLANVVLKDQWGRPRPYQTEAFDGERDFQPLWQPSGECARNCSFVSGEVAAAWALTVPALCLFGRRRLLVVQGVIGAFTAAIAAARISVGSHFLSDALMAVLLTEMVIWACYHWLYVVAPSWAESERIDRFMGMIGDRLRALLGMDDRQEGAAPAALGLAIMELIDETALRLGLEPVRQQVR